MVGSWRYWISIRRYWLVLGGTASTRAVLVVTWRYYWVSIRQYWFVLGGTGSVYSSTGRSFVVLDQ